MAHFQLGKGWRPESRAEKISSRTRARRSIEPVQHRAQLLVFVIVPFGRNLVGDLAQLRFAHALFDPRKPGLERIDARDMLIDAVARIEPAQRRIGKIPLAGIEAKSLVDHHGLIARAPRLDRKNGLPPVGVAGPLVEDQHPGEIRQIFGLAQLLVGQKIVDRQARRIARIARPNCLPGAARRPARCPAASPGRPSARSVRAAPRPLPSAARAAPIAPPALFQAFRSPECEHAAGYFGT